MNSKTGILFSFYITAGWWKKSGLIILVLAHRPREKGSCFFPRGLTFRGCLLSKSYLFCWVAPFVNLWVEKDSFSLGLLCLCSLARPHCWSFHYPVWNFMRETKSKLKKFATVSFLGSSDSQAVCFLVPLCSLLRFVLKIMSRPFCCTYWET